MLIRAENHIVGNRKIHTPRLVRSGTMFHCRLRAMEDAKFYGQNDARRFECKRADELSDDRACAQD